MTTLTLPTYADVVAASERILGHAHRTPVMTSRTANEEFGAELFFKCENLQRIGAFKFRGAFNALSKFTPEQRKRGVVLARALAGELPLADRLREKERAYSERARQRPPTIKWFDQEATDATVLEIRTEDSIGLLTRITAALERSGVNVSSARISSLGFAVVAAFYLTTRRGARITPAAQRDIEVELRRI